MNTSFPTSVTPSSLNNADPSRHTQSVTKSRSTLASGDAGRGGSTDGQSSKLRSSQNPRSRIIIAALLLVWWAVVIPLHGDTIYSTGFEAPEFMVGSLGTGNGLQTQSSQWSLFAASNGSDVLNVVRVQSTVVRSGTQALKVQAAPANSIQSGFSTGQENSASIVSIEADAQLGSATSQTVWQFAVGDQSAVGGFVGGFNIAPDDGRFQIITVGFPQTGPIVARNTWYHFQLLFDLTKQTYGVVVDSTVVASQVPFLTHADKLRIFQFDTFAGGNDVAYFDNFSFRGFPAAFVKVVSRTSQQCSVQVNGQAGASYTLERSPDLQTWSTLTVLSVPASGTITYADTNATMPSAFYRVRYQ